MSLDHAILGFLNYTPLSGYDLKKVFDISVQHFWSADQSQIYRTLSHLEEQGWVEVEVVNQVDRPDRKVYHITDDGREELLSWLVVEPRERASRSAALVQVFFFGQLSDEVVLERFERYLQKMKAVLARYEQVPESLASGMPFSGSERENYFWMLTLDLGFRTVRANIEWAENAIAMLKKNEVPQD